MFLLNAFEYVLAGLHPSDRKCETLINYIMEMKFDRSRPEVFSASSPPKTLTQKTSEPQGSNLSVFHLKLSSSYKFLLICRGVRT